MLFSKFSADIDAEKNPLYVLHDRLKAEGRPIVDLVRGNVNELGIVYPPGLLQKILSDAAVAARVYRPDSLGQLVARDAIAQFYSSSLNRISARQILVTPGTSISYWYCFKLLAEAGEEILCPQPSYPLFDYIAKVSGVTLTHYRLLEEHEWAIDMDDLEHQITPRTRAIVVISPHNPTGMVADSNQLRELAGIAERRHIPIISDEVFSEFLFGLDALPRVAATNAPLVFTLNGFSKLFALPGMKIGWMAISGDEGLVRKALAALELISDTFLPVNEIAQFAVPGIFNCGREFLREYTGWISERRDALIEGLAGMEFIPPKGGFYVTVRIRTDEETAVARLLEEHGILAHPGYFYDIQPDHLVLTFIADPGFLRTLSARMETGTCL